MSRPDSSGDWSWDDGEKVDDTVLSFFMVGEPGGNDELVGHFVHEDSTVGADKDWLTEIALCSTKASGW